MFLSLTGEFKHPLVNEILETDREISDEIYNKFFELQSLGKEFKVKDINGSTFDEIFEEVIHDPTPYEPSLEEKNRADIDYLSIMIGVDL